MELINDVATMTNDALVGNSKIPLITKVGTLVLGAGSLARGTVLGKITIGAATSAAKTGGNTGNGTLTMDATTPILAGAKPGVYKVRVVRAAIAAPGTTPAVAAQKAIVEFKDPDGELLEVLDLATTPGNTVTNQLKFAVLEGATPFAADDGFDITVAAGSGSYKTVNSANLDGSAVAECILAEAADATSAAVAAVMYETGAFNASALVFGGSDTYATHKAALKAAGIFLTDEQ